MSKVIILKSFSVPVASLVGLFVVFLDLGYCRKIVVQGSKGVYGTAQVVLAGVSKSPGVPSGGVRRGRLLQII